jgi:hypothetical protein
VTGVWFLSVTMQAITFRNVDLANLKTRLHEAARAHSQQFQRGLRFRRFEQFCRLRAIRSRNPVINGRPRYSGNNFFSFINTPRASTRKCGVGLKRIGNRFGRDPRDRFALGDRDVDLAWQLCE